MARGDLRATSGQAGSMSDLDDEKAGPQIVPDGPRGAPPNPSPTDKESATRQAEEHDRPDDDRDDPA
jgi:hypothetical protein